MVTLKEVNPEGIQFPTLAYVPLSELYYEEDVNRDEYKSHTETFEDVIQEVNFLDVIKVFPKNKKGYKIAEASHRGRSLNNIFKDKQDFRKVPIAILDWLDGSNEMEVKSTVIRFNNTGKTWTLFDYVKAHANTKYFKKSVSNLWNEIMENMKLNKKLMSNSVVLGIYTGQKIGQDIVKDENKAQNFRLSNYDRKVVDYILAGMVNLVSKLGKQDVPVLFQRIFVNHLRQEADRLNNINEFESYFTQLKPFIAAQCRTDSGLPLDEKTFETWRTTTISIANAA